MAVVSVPKEASEQSDDFLSPDEVLTALAAFSAAEKLRLSGIEGIRRRGTGYARGALLAEAMSRVCLGKRRCPRNVSVPAFIAQTMRSIAFHDRETRKADAALYLEPKAFADANESGTTPALDRAASQQAIRSTSSVENVNEIYHHFDGDEEAKLVILAWSQGLRGLELRNETGLDQAAIDYAAKRIRKKMRKLYPEGYVA
jgi:hypothetical protein